MPLQKELIKLLQNAYSGERAAWHAYEGHWRSVSNSVEQTEIRNIRDDEWRHRECVGAFLGRLGAAPRLSREFMMLMIGFAIRGLCYVGGWFIPMYGAGKLERGNIVEYEVAARLAHRAGFDDMASELLHMAEVEWDHELYFRTKSESHWLNRWIPVWPAPQSREQIRNSFLLEYPRFSKQMTGVTGRN
jgi:hypothetical protein